jgi:hypothetical protein
VNGDAEKKLPIYDKRISEINLVNKRSGGGVYREMNTFRSIVGAVLLTAGAAFAAEPPQLFEEPAAKLINLQIEGHQERIVIASIVEGSVKEGPFEAKHVRRVVAIHPVLENGKMVRRMCTYDFLWNETYGWFSWQKREERGGDAVWIWSELRGEVVVR